MPSGKFDTRTVGLKKCTKENIERLNPTEDSYMKEQITNMQCMDAYEWKSNELLGTDQASAAKLLVIDVPRCGYYDKGAICKSEEEIDLWLKNHFLLFYVNQNNYNP